MMTVIIIALHGKNVRLHLYFYKFDYLSDIEFTESEIPRRLHIIGNRKCDPLIYFNLMYNPLMIPRC